MAVVKDILKVMSREAIVKISGDGGSSTISLANDLTSSSEVADVGGQNVAIKSMFCSGLHGSEFTITRNGKLVFAGTGDGQGVIEFGAGFTDDVEDSSDLVVTITGTACLWLHLRKKSGWNNKFEPTIYGSYDDPNQVGQ